MTKRLLLAGVAAGLLLWGGAVLGQTKPAECDRGRARTPEKVEGQVVQVDPDQGTLTLRGTDGTPHEFQASKETLQNYKVGDRLAAKLRSAPNCP
jgi:hypothetical protein